MKRIYFTFVVAVLIGSSVFGQDHRLKRKADQLYGRLSYELAIPYYIRYLKKHGEEAGAPAAIRNLTDAYRLTHDYEKAAAWYPLVLLQEQVDPLAYFYYGHALLQTGDREKAREMFARYDDNAPEINGVRDIRGANFIAALDKYDKLMADSALAEVSLMPFNTEGAEFGAVPYGDGIIFASARDEGPPVIHDFNWLDTPFLNFFYTEKKKDSSEWKKPEFLKGEVNTRYHESNFSKIEGDSTFYFTRNSFYERKKGRDEKGVIKLNIYKGIIEGQKTSGVEAFPLNNDNYSVTHPALSADGQTLYFVSDMPGGAGGKDIYRCQRQGEGWGKAENIREINTPGDEAFPFVHADGTLYFSSDGHPGLGKLDIFSVRMEGNRRAVNMGYPVNSAHDDFAFYLAENHEDGYLASNRPGGVGDDDIYAVKLLKPIIEVYVLDARDRSPIGNAQLEISSEDEVENYETDDYGFVTFFGAYNRDYLAKASREPFYDGEKAWSTVTQTGQSSFRVEVLLKTPPDVISAIVIDDSTSKRLPGAKVEFVNRLNRDEVKTLYADKFGRVMLDTENEFDKNTRYEVYVSNKGYFSYQINDYDIQRAMQGDTIFPLRVDKIVLNKPILLENIHYDFDKWDILAEAYGDLEKVALLMIRNPDIIVEMMSHTDCRGNDRYNQRLSQKRANSARNHLILYFGIDPERVQARGYGEEQIANECHDGIFCTEPQHRANRRTEFRVIGYIEGVDMENSVLETNEQDDPTPQAGKSAAEERARREKAARDTTGSVEPVGTKYTPGNSEELDKEAPVDPADWPTWDAPAPEEKPAPTPMPTPTPAADPAKVETIPSGNPVPVPGGVTDYTGDEEPSGFTLPSVKYEPNANTFGMYTVYRIKVGVFREALSEASLARLKDLLAYTFVVEGENGMLSYYIGEYLTTADVRSALQQVKTAGFNGAYILGYENGKEVGPADLRELLR